MNPKVFISYSQTSQEHKKKVIYLAEHLMSSGVDVIADFWNLNPGNDVYKFMEQSVTDTSITHVLIVCDKRYCEKADSRKGGVGDETAIITPEVYGKVEQTKFVPIIYEKDENGMHFIPKYLKSRIYIDLSDEYEDGYERLLRHLFGKPLEVKPSLGNTPSWINNNNSSLTPIESIIRQLQNPNLVSGKTNTLKRQFIVEYINILRTFEVNEVVTDFKTILDKIDGLKPIRDRYIEYLTVLIEKEIIDSGYIIEFLQEIHNGCMTIKIGSYNHAMIEHFKFFIWEIFVCTVTHLSYFDKYTIIKELLNATYFLKPYFFEKSAEQPTSFLSFLQHCEVIESDCKKAYEDKNLYSFSADMLLKREYLPSITKDRIIFVDILLCQLSFVLNNKENDYAWFPYTYCYFDNKVLAHLNKLVSRRYCEKFLQLFNVKFAQDLIRVIKEKPVSSKHKYHGQVVASITSWIDINKIGSLN